ncbi:MAG TPA: YraN family protein [Bacteroidetes bacterium]|nr:YraN family protein [Bacteroidota bacterium]
MAVRGKKLGAWGEQAACSYLAGKGYEIVQRNYRTARGEIDIIAREGATLIFVEVKTATSLRMGDPVTWVTPKKQQQIAMMASLYLAENELVDINCRFDVIGVVRSGEQAVIEHIINAFWI